MIRPGEYRKESDQVSRFIDSDGIEKAAGDSVKASELYEAYKRWCESEGETPITANALGRRVIELGYERKHMNSGNSYQGLRLSASSKVEINRLNRLRETRG